MEIRLTSMALAAGLRPEDPGQQAMASPSNLHASPVNPPAAFPHPAAAEDDPAQSGVGFCECCGATGIPAAGLEQIDSGQLLCPDCLHTLRVDALRAELDTLAASLA